MAQIPVLAYAIGVATNPQVNPPARISVQLQAGGPFQPIPINSPSEFLALAAVLATPGRLFFDNQTFLLERIQP
jgi:hypothetical protein